MHQLNVMVTDDMLEEFVTKTTSLYFSILRRGCNTGYEATRYRRTTMFRRYRLIEKLNKKNTRISAI